MRDVATLLAWLIGTVLVVQLLALAFLIWLVSKVQTIFRDVLFIRDDTLNVLNICEFLKGEGMYEVTKKVTKALERSKAPLSIAEICKKARLREWQVSQELSHLGAMGRLDMVAENLGGTWAAVRGHDPMVVKYSLKPEPDLSFLNS